MLVNKADRLGAEDLATRDGRAWPLALETTGVGSWGPPLALSAKKALAGKLGGAAEALAESGWPAVQALLEEQIVARSAELKERALRRRASALVGGLLDAWAARDAADRADAAAQAERAHAAARSATRVERDADDIAERLAASLSPQAAAWTRDLELVFIGRDPEAAARDPVLARYRVDRAVATLAPALSRALSAIAADVDLPPARLAPQVRAAVRAVAWCAPAEGLGRDLAAERAPALLPAMAQAAVATLVEQLLAMSVAPAPSDRGARDVLRELHAFRAALGG